MYALIIIATISGHVTTMQPSERLSLDNCHIVAKETIKGGYSDYTDAQYVCVKVK